MLAPSDSAPVSWRVDQTEAEIRRQVLELQPDFVFFQELPAMVPFIETHNLLSAHTISHSGTIATLIKKELADLFQAGKIERFAVTASSQELGITLANVHFVPGRGESGRRQEMMKKIASQFGDQGLLIVGDTNTRVEEVAGFESLGLVGRKPPAPTWDTHSNRFRHDAPKFKAYFTRYFHNSKVVVDSVKVFDDPVQADGKSFYLSDHFPMSGIVKRSEG